MFDPRSILDAIVKGSGEPQGRASSSRDDAMGSIGDLLKQLAGGDDASGQTQEAPARTGRTSAARPVEERSGSDAADNDEPEPTPARPTRAARGRTPASEDADSGTPAAGCGLEDVIRDVLGGKAGGGLKDIMDKVNQKGGLGEVLGPVLGQIFGQKAGGARLAETGDGSGPTDALAERIKALSGGRSPEELMAVVKDMLAKNQFGAGMAAGGLGALVLGTRAGRSIATTAAKLGGLAVIGGLAYKAYNNYQQGATASSGASAHQNLIAPPTGSGFEAAAVSQDLATTMLKAMVAAAAADGRIDPAEHEKLVAGFGGAAMTPEAQAFLAREIASPASVAEIAAHVSSPEEAVQVFTAARITVDADEAADHAFLSELATALELDDELLAHIDAAARGGT